MTAVREAPRRYLAREVVQTSAMDCGPAALTSLLGGFGIQADYGRLREACRTDLDGTSIDAIEDAASLLGLDAEQCLVPLDHLSRTDAGSLPSLVVVRQADGLPHFVVAWRLHGRRVQVMDPASGRRWPSRERFLEQVYEHESEIPAAEWRLFAGSERFLDVLEKRLLESGVDRKRRERAIRRACGDPSWRSLAALDAATRLLGSLVRSGGVPRSKAGELLEVLFARALEGLEEESEDRDVVPQEFWSALRVGIDELGEDVLAVRGAVIVFVHGRKSAAESVAPTRNEAPGLAAALEKESSRPGRALLRMLREDGLLAPAVLFVALAVGAIGVVVEALLFRGLLDVSSDLTLPEQRYGLLAGLLAFLAIGLLLDVSVSGGILRAGRKLEARFRIALLRKIPRMGDRFLRSRLTSDMAERAHSVDALRGVPELGAGLVGTCFELALTAAGVIWLDVAAAPQVVLLVAISIMLPLAVQPVLLERDLRVRSHLGALSRYYLDALLGGVAVRAHDADRALRRQHEGALVLWAEAGLRLQRAVVSAEGVRSLACLSVVAWMLFGYAGRASDLGGMLLFAYWVLNLPALGAVLASLAQQYPSLRNVTLRLLEPLGAPEETADEDSTAEPVRDPLPGAEARTRPGAAIRMEGVSVRAAGHPILEGIDLDLEPGAHVAIVGPSGAGKSSLVGVLLGWHSVAEGRATVDGEALTGERIARIRREIAWVDPSIQIWNRTLLDNLLYGATPEQAAELGRGIDAADLRSVLERLPEGYHTRLGENGSLLSGGEGQRVRLGRALLRPDARLAVLDEPFRGLDRAKRRELLARARTWWKDATLLCVTHDVAETLAFDRIVVLDEGRVVETGAPSAIAADPDSLYRRMLDAEDSVRRGSWSEGTWRKLRLDRGRLVEDEPHSETGRTL